MAAQVVTAYSLHTRPYQESAVICELFSRELGRIAVIAHGARGVRRRNAMGAFVALQVELGGRREPQSVRRVDALETRWLEGEALAAGIYLNELLVRLLPAHDAHEQLFDAYAQTVASLPHSGGELGPLLRRFEQALLAELGYAVRCDCDAAGVPIRAEASYRWDPGAGFVADRGGEFPGEVVLCIGADDFAERVTRSAARRLYAAAFATLLDGKPLRSRMLLPPSGSVAPLPTAGNDDVDE